MKKWKNKYSRLRSRCGSRCVYLYMCRLCRLCGVVLVVAGYRILQTVAKMLMNLVGVLYSHSFAYKRIWNDFFVVVVALIVCLYVGEQWTTWCLMVDTGHCSAEHNDNFKRKQKNMYFYNNKMPSYRNWSGQLLSHYMAWLWGELKWKNHIQFVSKVPFFSANEGNNNNTVLWTYL